MFLLLDASCSAISKESAQEAENAANTATKDDETIQEENTQEVYYLLLTSKHFRIANHEHVSFYLEGLDIVINRELEFYRKIDHKKYDYILQTGDL